MKQKNAIAPEHPGKLLKEEMEARRVSIQGLARALRVPATRIHAIVHGRRSITAYTSARLGRYLGVSHGACRSTTTCAPSTTPKSKKKCYPRPANISP